MTGNWHGDRERCVSTSGWLVCVGGKGELGRRQEKRERETDKSSLSSWVVVSMSCGERHWQYEVMLAGMGKKLLYLLHYSYTASLSGVMINYDTPVVCDFLLWWPWFNPFKFWSNYPFIPSINLFHPHFLSFLFPQSQILICSFSVSESLGTCLRS